MSQEQTLNDILEIVQFIRDNAVSKEDAKAFATKDDLKAFATKDDLKAFELRMEERFATKEDFERFMTREEFLQMKDEIMTHLDGLAVVVKALSKNNLDNSHPIVRPSSVAPRSRNPHCSAATAPVSLGRSNEIWPNAGRDLRNLFLDKA